jgi:hypothetical protein
VSVPRDWDAVIRESRGEPIGFVLGGREFSVPTPLSGAAFIDYADRDDQSAPAFLELICNWIDPDGYAGVAPPDEELRSGFREAYRRSRGSVDDLIALTRWIVEEATARPTVRPSGSPGPPLANGASTSAGPSATAVRSRGRTTRSG